MESRDYQIMAEEEYLVITNLCVNTHPCQSGWILFVFPGSKRSIVYKVSTRAANSNFHF